MIETVVPYWVGNVAHIQFSSGAVRTGPDSVAPVYGVDTPQRWPIPPRATRWIPRLPVRTDAEREAFSAKFKAQVEAKIAEREARRQAKRKLVRLVTGSVESEPSTDRADYRQDVIDRL